MLNDKIWNDITNDMFEEAYIEYEKTNTNKEIRTRYSQILEELFDNYDNSLANKMNGYLFELNQFTKSRAKELYIMRMKDVISLLKKLDIIT